MVFLTHTSQPAQLAFTYESHTNPTHADRLEATAFCNAMGRVENPWSISRHRTSLGWSTLPLGSTGARNAELKHTFTKFLMLYIMPSIAVFTVIRPPSSLVDRSYFLFFL